jgi:hypothetical protein
MKRYQKSAASLRLFAPKSSQLKEELEKTGKALKRMVDPHLLRETMTGYSLTDQLAAVEAALEGLRTAAEAARQDLIQSRQYLMESYNALGWVLEEEWIDIESDWTMERREAFHVKMDEGKTTSCDSHKRCNKFGARLSTFASRFTYGYRAIAPRSSNCQ